MPEFPGKLRIGANPFDLVGADIAVEEGCLALIVSDNEVGEWPLDELGIEVAVDGFHIIVEGEEFIFTTGNPAAFARALGMESNRPGSKKKLAKRSKLPKTNRRRSSRPAPIKQSRPETDTVAFTSEPVEVAFAVPATATIAKPRKPTAAPVRTKAAKRPPAVEKPAKAPRPPRPRTKLEAWLAEIDYSDRKVRLVLAAGAVFLLMAIFVRGVLIGVLLLTGIAGLIVAGAAAVDPLLATRLPDDWPPSRLALTAFIAAGVGAVLAAF
ncbi:MAG: hypothetical protein ACT4OP_11345 [Actinomycetota bacterium]